MVKLIFGNAMWHLITESDGMSKAVLFTLLGMSILCWTILLYKVVLLRIKKYQLKRAIEFFKKADTFEDILTATTQFNSTFPGYLLSNSLMSLKTLLAGKKEGVHARLDKREQQLLDNAIDQTASQMLNKEESYLSVLSASAAMSPLLGLFGTVWGLVVSFIAISQKQNADIATVAPGIAEALVTTLAGLMVAIPALGMVYYLNAQVRSVEVDLYVLADRFTWVTHRLFGMEKGEDQRDDLPADSVDQQDKNQGEVQWHE